MALPYCRMLAENRDQLETEIFLRLSAAGVLNGHVVPEPVLRGRVRLLVDAFVRVLRKEHEVMAFTSGHEALAHLAQDPRYDVILCDLMMPEVSGIEVFERVTQADPSSAVRFLFMTGGAFTPRARQFVQDNRERTLDKPIRARTLRQRVARHAAEVMESLGPRGARVDAR